MRWNSRTRCAIVCLGFVLLFSTFSFRLIYLQMIKHDQYAGLAAEKHVIKQPIFANRGTILDVNNEVLANNVPVETVVMPLADQPPNAWASGPCNREK